MTSILVESSNTNYSNDSRGVLFNYDKTTLIQYPLGNTSTTYTIPNTVTTLGNYAFYFAQHLSNIIIPSRVTTIPGDVFGNSRSLTTINIPPLITHLGVSLFAGSNNLTTVIFDSSNNLLTIGEYVFQDTAISSITLPNSVTSIGSNAFLGAGSLSSIIIPPAVTSIGSNAFLNCTALVSVSLTLNTINTLNSAGASPPIPTGGGALSSFYGSGGVTIIVIPSSSSIVSDPEPAPEPEPEPEPDPPQEPSIFKYSDDTTSSTSDTILTTSSYSIPAGQTLVNVNVGNLVTSIESYTFTIINSTLDTLSFTPIPVITTIGQYAFRNCNVLSQVYIPKSVTTIGQNAFQNCTS